MSENYLTKDSIELLILRSRDDHDRKIEHLYVKKADVKIIVNEMIKDNVFIKGVKWVAVTILVTFGVAAVNLVFQSFNA